MLVKHKDQDAYNLRLSAFPSWNGQIGQAVPIKHVKPSVFDKVIWDPSYRVRLIRDLLSTIENSSLKYSSLFCSLHEKASVAITHVLLLAYNSENSK